MRVLITNSLVLAAISLAPSVSAAPYTPTSAVGFHEHFPNSTVFNQVPGTSPVPSTLHRNGRTIELSHPRLDFRRDEVIHVESLYDSTTSGNFFKPVADLFKNIGMNVMSDNPPPTEKALLTKLHDELDNFVTELSPPVPRSLEGIQTVDLPAPLNSLSVLGAPLFRIVDLLTPPGIEGDPTASLTDRQKQLAEKLRTVLGTVLEDVGTGIPSPGALPLNNPRSFEERSLESIVSDITRVSFLDWALAPVTGFMSTHGLTDGNPLDDAKKALLSKVQAGVVKVVQKIQDGSNTVRIQHNREEHEHLDHDDQHHDPHRDDHHSHDEHKYDGESGEDNDKPRQRQKGDGKPHDAHKDGREHPAIRAQQPESHSDGRHSHGEHEHDGKHSEDSNWSRHGQKDDGEPHDAHKDSRESPAIRAHQPESHNDDHHSHDEHKHDGKHSEDSNRSRHGQEDDGEPHDSHKDGHESPAVRTEDRHTHGPNREGGRCQQPRDGQWDDCRHHHDGKDRNEGSSLLKLSLGGSHHG